jgi:hypothetical protein
MTAMIVGGAVVALAAIVFLGTQLFGGSDTSTPPAPNQVSDNAVPSGNAGNAAGSTSASRESVVQGRSGSTVAIFNGTTTPGLAQSTNERLVSAGYPENGKTGNAPDQTRQTSTVYYASGERRQAGDIARLLNISDLQRMDGDTQALAGGNAKLLVILGSDKAPNP